MCQYYKEMSMKYKIKKLWIYIIYRFPYRLKRSFRWFKLMYNNHEWDHRFLMDILKYKLEDMKIFYTIENQYCLEIKDDTRLDIILEILTAIDIYEKDEYDYSDKNLTIFEEESIQWKHVWNLVAEKGEWLWD